jgi:hypothetical protein
MLTELAPGFTVQDYETALANRDRNTIADALRERFMVRYVKPAMGGNYKHGFTMMAISCLMIEALESFRQGWENSNKKSKEAFGHFFNSSEPFKVFRCRCQEFYSNIRCGILHQAETTGGWRITRKKGRPLFDHASLTINAEDFLKKLRLVLDKYCDGLKTADWESQSWMHVRKKMKALCDNCRA